MDAAGRLHLVDGCGGYCVRGQATTETGIDEDMGRSHDFRVDDLIFDPDVDAADITVEDGTETWF